MGRLSSRQAAQSGHQFPLKEPSPIITRGFISSQGLHCGRAFHRGLLDHFAAEEGAGPRVMGFGEELFGRADLDALAVQEEGGAVGQASGFPRIRSS